MVGKSFCKASMLSFVSNLPARLGFDLHYKGLQSVCHVHNALPTRGPYAGVVGIHSPNLRILLDRNNKNLYRRPTLALMDEFEA